MQFICPACGAQAVIPPGAASASFHCPACGTLVLPPPPGIPPIHPTIAADRASDIADDVGFDFSQLKRETSPPRAGPRKPRAAVNRGWWVGAGILLVAGAVLLTARAQRSGQSRVPSTLPAIASNPTNDDWARAAGPQLLAQKESADALAIAGRLQEAYDRYASLLKTIAAHDSHDPVILTVQEGTRAAQDQVLAAILREKAAPAPSATTEPDEAAPQPVLPAPVEPPVAAASTTSVPPPQQPIPAPIEPLPPRPPLALRTYYEPNAVTDEQIAAAIHRGAVYLQREFRNGQLQLQSQPADDPQYMGALNAQGIDALCVYALLHAGQSVSEPWLASHAPFTQQMLAILKEYRLDFTYHRSLRAAALAVYNRPEDLACLEDDTRWLVQASHGGAYSYTATLMQNQVGGFGPGNPGGAVIPANSARVPAGYSAPAMHPSGGIGSVSTRNGTTIVGGAEVINGKTVPIGPSGDFLNTTGSSSGWVKLSNGQIGGWSSSSGQSLPMTTTVQQPPNRVYGPAPAGAMENSFAWDNSNSQYGLLGVWSGADAGVAVPAGYWQAVQQHWVSCQLPGGAWSYIASGQPSLSMTDAGLASLMVTSDYLARSGMNWPAADAAVARALAGLDQGDNAVTTLGAAGWYGYALYGLERVGLASGYKFFGKHDWYAEFAKKLVQAQHADGSWGPTQASYETDIDTAYALLFLSRGRHPVLMNKLRYNGDWNNYPHDLSNLARFASSELERPINWQVINTASDWTNWMDCPVLYIAGDRPPNLNQHDLHQLRSFALAGGVIFTHADRGSDNFNRWAAKLARSLFPQWPLAPIAAKDPLYSTLFPIDSKQVPLLGVSNGARLVMVHSQQDLAQTWQRQWTDTGKLDFQLAINLFLYANGKTNLLNRLQTPFIPQWSGIAQQRHTVLRLSYDGDWDPEPYAWTRFARYFTWETGDDLDVQQSPLSKLPADCTSLAVLTGCAAHKFSDAEVQAVQRFIAGGGTLLIDACGGSSAFADSVRDLLARMFPKTATRPLAPTDPVLLANAPGADDLTKPMLRPFAMEQRGANAGAETLSFGQGKVIFSPLDLTTGLLGTNTWPIIGYDPAYAAALVKNVVLWADARVSAKPTTAP